MNQDDQASEWQEKIEMTLDLLTELKDKARQRGLSLFAYLAHFVSQDNEDIRRKVPVSIEWQSPAIPSFLDGKLQMVYRA